MPESHTLIKQIFEIFIRGLFKILLPYNNNNNINDKILPCITIRLSVKIYESILFYAIGFRCVYRMGTTGEHDYQICFRI